MTLPTVWAEALRARETHFDLRDTDLGVRLLHGEDDGVRCDRFGDVCWFYRYAPGEPGTDETGAYDDLAAAAGARHWHAHGMGDRGRDPQARRHWASPGAPDAWRATEEGLAYHLRADRGQSPGLFLDQRRNRAWVRQLAGGARLLNLFAYTGGFGVAALAGGARQVVQVDVSRAYLEWAADNARANGFDPATLGNDALEHAAVDARLFLQGCRKRGRRFDGVVCDPPSFGRAGGRGARGRGARGRGKGVFRVETELADLVRACVDVVDPGGWVLVSSNYEGWTAEGFTAAVGGGAGRGAGIEPAPGPGADFPPKGTAPVLRSCIVRVA